jgi:hypothetical protein
MRVAQVVKRRSRIKASLRRCLRQHAPSDVPVVVTAPGLADEDKIAGTSFA